MKTSTLRSKTVLTMVASLLLGACHAMPMQPPPAEQSLWSKPGADAEQVGLAMDACGYRNRAGVDPDASLERKAEQFQCMKRAGFVRTNGFDICNQGNNRRLKACQPQP